MGKSQRTKGQIGEREFADLINKKLEVEYRRTPMSGGLDFKGDIQRGYGSKQSRIDDFSIEVKRQESLNIHKAMEQSIRDCRDKTPIVAHRRNKDEWKVTILASDFLDLLRELDDLSSV